MRKHKKRVAFFAGITIAVFILGAAMGFRNFYDLLKEWQTGLSGLAAAWLGYRLIKVTEKQAEISGAQAALERLARMRDDIEALKQKIRVRAKAIFKNAGAGSGTLQREAAGLRKTYPDFIDAILEGYQDIAAEDRSYPPLDNFLSLMRNYEPNEAWPTRYPN